MGAVPRRLKQHGTVCMSYLPYLLRVGVFVAASILSLKVRDRCSVIRLHPCSSAGIIRFVQQNRIDSYQTLMQIAC